VVEKFEDNTSRVVQSSSRYGWPPESPIRRMEVAGERGKAVWYMCWADIWIGWK